MGTPPRLRSRPGTGRCPANILRRVRRSTGPVGERPRVRAGWQPALNSIDPIYFSLARDGTRLALAITNLPLTPPCHGELRRPLAQVCRQAYSKHTDECHMPNEPSGHTLFPDPRGTGRSKRRGHLWATRCGEGILAGSGTKKGFGFMSKKSAGHDSFLEHSLREVREGQVLKLAGSHFTVLTQERRHRLVHLNLEAEGGGQATLIGVPGARVRLREGMRMAHSPGDSSTDPVAGVRDGDVQPVEGGR